MLAAALLATLSNTGCNQQSSSSSTPTPPPTSADTKPSPTSSSSASPVAPSPAAPNPSALSELAKNQAQALIEQAQKLVKSNQYLDASKILKDLTASNLTPDQAQIVAQLQPLVEQALKSDAVRQQAQVLIDKAQQLVSGSKFEEASNVLKQLASVQLSAEQQKMVADLKSVVEKAVAAKVTSEGVKAVGDLFKKK